MKHPVKISTFSLILSIISAVLLISIFIVGIRRAMPLWQTLALAGLLLVILISTLFYAPLSISVDDDAVSIKRVLKTKRIPLSTIKSVKLCPPTLAERRICGSGGWFGYWGWFREPSIGRYFAYYGKASDCFLVTLRNGRMYLLGCDNPAPVVDCINTRLQK